MDQERYRIAQWATGHTGMHSLRKVIELAGAASRPAAVTNRQLADGGSVEQSLAA